MARANFFHKAALAASDVLQGFEPERSAALLESHTIAVCFDDAAGRSREAMTTLELMVNLLARLYPRIALVPDGAQAASLLPRLGAIACSINPIIEIHGDLDSASAVVAVGTSRVMSAAPTIYLGSSAWICRISSRGPVGSQDSSNPYGAAAAACFGAANVFRALFSTQLANGALDDHFALSLLDLDPSASSPANPDFGPIDLGESFLVGIGAIGNAAVWSLARTPDLRGKLHLIDAETVDLSNMQRYVLTTQADAAHNRSKVTLAANALQGTTLNVECHQRSWGAYLRDRGEWHLQRVGVAVDSAEARRTVQAALPRWIVNAWTQRGDLGVSRHNFLGDQACLTCLYLPEGPQKHEDQLIADAIGLPGALKEVRQLLHTGAPVGRDWIDRIAAALGTAVEPLRRFENCPLRAFYSEAICGGLVLSLGGAGAITVSASAPMVFQSALAGILLAAELVANAAGYKVTPPPSTTSIDLLRPLGQFLSLPHKKHISGGCICQDLDYLDAYREKYGNNSR